MCSSRGRQLWTMRAEHTDDWGVLFLKKKKNTKPWTVYRNDDVSVERDRKLKKIVFSPFERVCSPRFWTPRFIRRPSTPPTETTGWFTGGWKSKVRANVHAVFITIGGRGCGGEDTGIAPTCIIPAADCTVEPQIRLPRKLINDRIARRTPSRRGHRRAESLLSVSVVFFSRYSFDAKKIFEIGKKRTHAHGTRGGLGFPQGVSRRSRRVRTAAFRTTHFRPNRENEPTENFSTTRLVRSVCSRNF